MAPRTKQKPKTNIEPSGYPRETLLCGPVTKASIAQAAKDLKRPKRSGFLRFVVEEWLQLNGYKVDEA